MRWIIPCLLASLNLVALEPNPPVWPDSVIVLSPDDTDAQNKVDAVYNQNGGHSPEDNHGQWSDARFAILFQPGNHTLNVNVGYYTSIIGLGKAPKDTQISNVICENGSFNYKNGALSNFWRSAENFYTKPSRHLWNDKAGMLWAVSQAAPLRRVFVDGDLYLYQYNEYDPNGKDPKKPNQMAGFSSGGFMGDCTVNGVIDSGSQQQWLTRNSYMGSWPAGNWNMVFLGCSNAPASHCGHPQPYTTVDATPVIAEKPYIMWDKNSNRYYLMVPKLETTKVGVTKDYDNVDQSEYPYDVTQQNYGDPGYVSYKVADSVHNHQAWGVGVYSYFRDNTVVVNTGIETPTGSCVHFTNSLSVFLDGKGQISHVINNTGDPVSAVNEQHYICEFP